MEKEMRELYIEGVAIHGGPEPCARTGDPTVTRCDDGRAGRAGKAEAVIP